MLNKLKYFKSLSKGPLPVMEADPVEDIAAAYITHWKENGNHVTLSSGTKGTLGITFFCDGLSSGPCFVKTHLPGEIYRDSLKKEMELLTSANLDRLHLDVISLSVHGHEQLYLQMDILTQAGEIKPADAKSMIRRYQKSISAENVCAYMYNITDMCTVALAELDILRDNGFFSQKSYLMAREKLLFLQEEISHLDICLCHGDLGDRNIMQNDDSHLVVIDWEDAFWGCKAYDYLYWLTFFNHRKFYSEECFSLGGLDAPHTSAILTMILVLKSTISFYSGSWQTNSVSMEDRLLEIWKYC